MEKKQYYAGGLELIFLPESALDPMINIVSTDMLIARQALARIIMAHPPKYKSNLSFYRGLKFVFCKREPQLVACMRQAFQEGFLHIWSQLKDKKLTQEQQKQAEFFISNCLCILPFSDISSHDSIQIPQYIKGTWVLVDYKTVPIELTPTFGFEKLFITESDRVFAYGLEPKNNSKAQPHLIFMGTTYPSGQGFNPQILTDLEGFETAGKRLYRTGHAQITAWLDKQTQKVHVCGTSLGGALSLLLAIDQGKKLSRVDALNPPGLYKPIRKSRYDNWDSFSINEQPPVYIQKQGNDIVSQFGFWKKEWNVLHVQPPEEINASNRFLDHALIYAGLAQTQFVLLDTEEDNKSRYQKTILLYQVTRGVIYYLFLYPFHYVLFPLIQYAFRHSIEIALITATILLFPYIPLVASLILIAMVTTYVSYSIFQGINELFTVLLGLNPVHEAVCHQREEVQHEKLDVPQNKNESIDTTRPIKPFSFFKPAWDTPQDSLFAPSPA